MAERANPSFVDLRKKWWTCKGSVVCVKCVVCGKKLHYGMINCHYLCLLF
jgi:hypothetical protein